TGLRFQRDFEDEFTSAAAALERFTVRIEALAALDQLQPPVRFPRGDPRLASPLATPAPVHRPSLTRDDARFEGEPTREFLGFGECAPDGINGRVDIDRHFEAAVPGVFLRVRHDETPL